MKPLLICDCDEVLLHMARHFGAWVDEAHDMDFSWADGEFTKMLTRRDGADVTQEDMWALIDGFFPAQMHRQTLVPHARESLAVLAELADIVILTNLQDKCRAPRAAQLEAFGIVHRIETNQGGKGHPVARLMAEHNPSVAVFVDDIARHHQSVAELAPAVHRLHIVSEPALAAHVPPAPAAHARIDDWRDAREWIAARFAEGRAANG
ncbi:MAG: HAD family hydrolase [Sphingomonas sp.]|jgi:hypothetical protein